MKESFKNTRGNENEGNLKNDKNCAKYHNFKFLIGLNFKWKIAVGGHPLPLAS